MTAQQTTGGWTALTTTILALAASDPAAAKNPGQTYCFHGVCHRVLTLDETQRAVGRAETVVASFYDAPERDSGNPNIMTSSGERFEPGNDRTAASPVYPNGTRLLLWNPRTKAAVEVRVTNSGPYHGARRLDVSRGAAERLGFRPLGVSQLVVTVVAAPTPEEARYQKGRVYRPATGFMGLFETVESAGRALLAPIQGTLQGRPQVTPKSPQQAGRAPGPATGGVPTPTPIHTGTIGWTTGVQPIRPPLRRPQPSPGTGREPATRPPSEPALAPQPAAPPRASTLRLVPFDKPPLDQPTNDGRAPAKSLANRH